MGEPNRRDDQLTTADFASRSANREEAEATTAREGGAARSRSWSGAKAQESALRQRTSPA
jgi:hypothetical protein